MSTGNTANLSVGIKTEKAKTALQEMREELERLSKLRVSVSVAEAKKALEAGKFELPLDYSTLQAKIGGAVLNGLGGNDRQKGRQVKINTAHLSEQVAASVQAGLTGAALKVRGKNVQVDPSVIETINSQLKGITASIKVSPIDAGFVERTKTELGIALAGSGEVIRGQIEAALKAIDVRHIKADISINQLQINQELDEVVGKHRYLKLGLTKDGSDKLAGDVKASILAGIRGVPLAAETADVAVPVVVEEIKRRRSRKAPAAPDVATPAQAGAEASKAVQEALAGPFGITIKGAELTERVRDAVAAGMTGHTVGVTVPGAAHAGAIPNVQGLLDGLHSIVKPVLIHVADSGDQLAKAATQVASVARRTVPKEGGEGPTGRAVKSYSVRGEDGGMLRHTVSLPEPASVLATIQNLNAQKEVEKLAAERAKLALQHQLRLQGWRTRSEGQMESWRAGSAGRVDPRELLGIASRDEMKTIGQQIAAQMREGVQTEALRARSAGRVDPRELLGIASRDEMKAIGQQIAAQMREGVQTEALRAKSAGKVDARALLGLPSAGEMQAFGQQLAAQMREASTQAAKGMASRYEALKYEFSKTYTGQGPAIAAANALAAERGSRDEVRGFLGSKGHLLDQAADLEQLKRKAEGAGSAAKSLNNDLRGSRDAMNEAHSAARGLAGGLDMLWVTWGSTVPIIAGAAIAATLRGVYEEGKRVEYQLAFIHGLSGQGLEVRGIEDAMRGSMFGAKEGTDGLRALTQSGYSAREALSALPDVLNLATVGEVSVADAAFAATGVLKAFGLEVGEVGRVSDVLAMASSKSNASVQDMMTAFKYASASASLYGQSLEETGAAIAVLSEKNIKGSMAGTAHMNLLREIYTPTKKAAEAFKQLGLDMQELQRQGLTSTEIIDRIRVAAAKLDSTGMRAFTAAIGGERGTRELAPLLEGGTAKLAKMRADLEQSQGFTRSVMMELQNTVEASSLRMKQSLSFALSSAFEDGSGSVQKFNDTLSAAFSSKEFRDFVHQMSTGMVNLTRLLVDNADTVMKVAEAYLALKAASIAANSLNGMAASLGNVGREMRANLATMPGFVQALMVKTGAVTAAQVAEARLNAETARTAAVQAAAAGSLAAGSAAMTGFAAAAARAGVAASLVARGIAAVAGPVGIAITLVTTAISLWELFKGSQDKARDAQDSYTNSVANTNRVLDQEIERLERKRALHNNPGKSEAQVTVQSQIQAEENYIAAIEAARKNKVAGGATYNPLSDRTTIPMPDGTMKPMSGAEVAEAYKGLDKHKETLAAYKSKGAQIDRMTAEDSARMAQKAMQEWVDARKSELRARQAQGGKIGNAIEILDAYVTPESLGALKDTKQVEQVKRSLQGVADSGGVKFTMPNHEAESAALKLANAEFSNLTKEIRRNEQALQQEQQIRKELDDIKFSSERYGPYLSQLLSEQRAIQGLTDAQKLQQATLAKLQAAKASNPDAAFQERVRGEIEAAQDRLDFLKREIAGKRSVAAAKVDAYDANRQVDFDKRMSKIDLDDRQGIERAQTKILDKAVNPRVAAMEEARMASRAHYAGEINALEESINQKTQRRQELLDQFNLGPITQAQWESVDAVTKELGVEERLLNVAKQRRDLAGDRAAASAGNTYDYTQTAQYGWDKYWEKFKLGGESAAQQVQTVVGNSMNSLEGSVNKFVTTGKFGFRSFAASVASEIAQLMAKRAVIQFVGMLLTSFGGSSTPGVGTVNASAGNAVVPSNLAARGGVFTSYGPLDLHAQHFARGGTGGVAGGPQMNLIGEGSRPEAYVPLPDGRTIPVTVSGGGGGGNVEVSMNITVNNTGGAQVESDTSGKQAASLGKALEAAVLQVIDREKRPGGRLYA